ncbi:MAG: alpha/beta hydrolase [Tepidisphaeraceae bacterium]
MTTFDPSAPGIFACLLWLAIATGAAAQTTKPTTKPVLPPAPAGVVIEQDLEFLEPGRAERLDLYRPAEPPADGKLLGGIVMIHGGGWVRGDKAAAREFNIGTTLAKAGYVCVSVNYMMQPGRRWPTNLLDCKNAVRFLRKHAAKYGIDPNRIGVIGGSAGGHLALMVAYTADVPALEPASPYPGLSSRVGAVVNLYGITNLLTLRKTDEQGTPIGEPRETTALFKATRSEDPDLWRVASPVSHVAKSSPPTLILHGTIDTTVDRDQATELAARLKEVGAEHQIMMIDGIGHTFDLQTWRRKPLPQDLRPVVAGFFDKHLK